MNSFLSSCVQVWAIKRNMSLTMRHEVLFCWWKSLVSLVGNSLCSLVGCFQCSSRCNSMYSLVYSLGYTGSFFAEAAQLLQEAVHLNPVRL